MGLTEHENHIIYIANAISSSLSLLGCVFIILVYFWFKELQIFPFKLVTYLSLIDAFSSLAFILPGYTDSEVCQLQACMISYFTLSAVL